jgi:hypothetical protein
MKRIVSGKQLAIVVFALGVTAGCASTAQEPAPAGPSPEANQAIGAAKGAVAKATSLNWIWRDTEKLLSQAEAAAAEGDNAAAIKLANEAREEAELAVNQYYLEKAKALHAKASAGKSMSAPHKEVLSAASEAIRNAEGKKAYDMLAAYE